MKDVLRANDGAPLSALDPSPTSGPQLAAPPPGAWWVRVQSDAGHDRMVMLTEDAVVAGAADGAPVRLPVGPPSLVRLEKSGTHVSLERIAKWPFPRVTVEERAVKSELLSDGDAFSVGEFRISVHTAKPPKRGQS